MGEGVKEQKASVQTTASDLLTIRRVANGWTIAPGPGAQEFVHVATTPKQVAEHVEKWAAAGERNQKPFRTNDRD
jgi:hypothetical protein